jgi:SEC-C motif
MIATLSVLCRLISTVGLQREDCVIATSGSQLGCVYDGGVSCASIAIWKTSPAFDTTRKRRKSFPSETHVKRGRRFVHGDVELNEKLGRNDLCPCGSQRKFQAVLYGNRPSRWLEQA